MHFSLASLVSFADSGIVPSRPREQRDPVSDSHTLRGKFLIAGRNLRDPNFFKSVVLILEHNESGTLGLVVNRPTTVNVAEALHAPSKSELVSDQFIFVGGPVSPTALFILHNSRQLDPDAASVVPGVFLGSQKQVFEEVIAHVAAGKDAGKPKKLAFRVLCGCAGWGPGQLDGELARADWLIHPATESDVFLQEPHAMWDTLYQLALRSESIVPPLPGDPALN